MVTEIFPDPATGVVVARLAALDELTAELTILNVALLFDATVSKFVPVIVTGVPGVAIAGLNPEIAGAPFGGDTINEVLLVAEPAGEVTLIVPVVAPAGTVVMICVAVEEVTAAAAPLKVTVFWLGVALNPVPEMVTNVPAAPPFGVNSITAAVAELWRVMETRLPTAS